MLCAPCWRRLLRNSVLETALAPVATRSIGGLTGSRTPWSYDKSPFLRHHVHEAAASVSRRQFHFSRRLSDEPDVLPNHYATLELSITATTAEIKKQFYKLSKSHHPDLHPDNPNAKNRFLAISEAYTTLSSPTKRPLYDRAFLRTSSPQSAPSTSGSPGGRPASGLSKRRTTFRGPPPSFHRSGGWGSHSQKRSEAASQPSHSHPAAPGTGPGSTAAGAEVPHFDHAQHTSTHSTIERTRHQARRKKFERRMEEAQEDVRGGSSALVNFLLVGGILGVVFVVPVVVFGGGGGGSGSGNGKAGKKGEG